MITIFAIIIAAIVMFIIYEIAIHTGSDDPPDFPPFSG